MARDMPTLFVTGNGESRFDSGEEASEMDTTCKEGRGGQLTHSRPGKAVTKNNTGHCRGPVNGLVFKL